MSLLRRFLFAMLFTSVTLTMGGKVNDDKAGFDGPKPNGWSGAPVHAVALGWHSGQRANDANPSRQAFRMEEETLPAVLLPIQFKNPKDLGVGKLLVASRHFGDPNFSETVILLVHYDGNGVLGLVLNRRTNVPLSRVLDLKGAKDRSDPVYLGGPVGPTAVLALFQSTADVPGGADAGGEHSGSFSDGSILARPIPA